jgi:predicted nucleotidyltransferase component of viral defense system
MRRHHHRLSKDVDIFINDPQFINYLTPRLNNVAESLTRDYIEEHNYVKLIFPEGEIDFVAAPTITTAPTTREEILGRPFLVETSAEIIAKKIWHRGDSFKGRDILDTAMVAEREPAELSQIAPILEGRRDVILARIEKHGDSLREEFTALDVLDYRRSYDECVEIVRRVLASMTTK